MGEMLEQVQNELLVLRGQRGEEGALAELVRGWHGKLMGYAVRLVRDREGAEEVMQEVWVGIVRGIGKLEEPGAFGGWAFRIVGRECANWIGKKERGRRERAGGSMEEVAGGEVAEKAGGLEGVIAGLTVPHREVLVLHYFEGMGIEEMGRVLGVQVGTVKSRLHYARERVRAALGGQSDG